MDSIQQLYQRVADISGLSARLRTRPDGTAETRIEVGLELPQVIVPRERDQIAAAVGEFDAELRDCLI